VANPLKTYEELVAKAEAAMAATTTPDAVQIQVGSATCENAAGAVDVRAEFERHIQASGRSDIQLRQTGCTGRCSCEPIVSVIVPGQLPVRYEHVDRDAVHEIFTSHILGGKPIVERMLDTRLEAECKYELILCAGARCGKDFCTGVTEALQKKLDAAGVSEKEVNLIQSNCFGLCKRDKLGEHTHILVRPSKIIYRVTEDADLDEIIKTHIQGGETVERLLVSEEENINQRFFDLYGDVSFFNRQTRVALRNSGIIDPESLDNYVRCKGFAALARVLGEGSANAVIEELKASNLRGRGGGGYPTGFKWENAAKETADQKYIICNADEGDPGAFMDRSILEGDPFNVIEGMIIGGYAIGATQGFFYVRAEYPLAIERIQKAIDLCREAGILGKNILGSDFDFDLEIRLGAGAFVCGEETALIHSIEGKRGQPRIRPPYPSTSGLWGKPTIINNVETFANVPFVIYYGSQWFSRLGTEHSGGTKVFALAGKVNHTGLVEVPMGTTLREIVFGIGGGVADGKEVKAIQTGGPAGGCLPASMLDTPVDFDSLMAAGSIMGSGGMIVMDEDTCMVDIAKFFITFTQDESCGKCTPCREGTKRMLEILERITDGKGEMEDLDKLERLASLVKKSSLCGLGRAAPNPVLSTLKQFRDEYIAHIVDKRCPAKSCAKLLRYEINEEKCVGCTACARKCPVSCIAGKPKELHVIDQDKCIKCGQCYQVCRFEAVDRV
jgi:NADH-quinone oxidoreductase subunit F